MKTYSLAAHIGRTFFPFIVKDGYVVHQDFVHFWHGWIVLLQHRLRHYCEPSFHLPWSSTYVFRQIASLPRDGATWFFPETIEELAVEEIDEAFRWAANLVKPSYRPRLISGWVCLLMHAGQFAAARERYTYFLTQGFKPADFAEMLQFCLRFGLGDIDPEGKRVARHFPEASVIA